jgi:WD40 repeat protein
VERQADISRRETAAYWRGAIRTAAISAVVILIMAVLVHALLRERAQANYSEALAIRDRGRIGHRVESLIALDKARPWYGDRDALCSAAVAAIALPDLKVAPDFLPSTLTGSLTIDPEFQLYATNAPTGEVIVRHRETHAHYATVPARQPAVQAMHLSRGGDFMAITYEGEADHSLSLWSTRPERELWSWKHPVVPHSATFSPANDLLAFGTEHEGLASVQLVELHGDEVTLQPPLRGEAYEMRRPHVLRFHRTQPWLAEAAEGRQEIRLWDLESRDRAERGLPSAVLDMAFHPQRPLLLVACEAKDLYLIRCQRQPAVAGSGLKMEEPIKLAGHHAAVLGVAFAPKGDLFTSLSEDHTLRVWRAEELPRLRSPTVQSALIPSFELPLGIASLEQVRFSGNGRFLLASSPDGYPFKAWQVLSGEYRLLTEDERRGSPFQAIQFDKANRFLAAAAAEGITLWSLQSGACLGRTPFRPHHQDSPTTPWTTLSARFSEATDFWGLWLHSGNGVELHPLVVKGQEPKIGLELGKARHKLDYEGLGAFEVAKRSGAVVAARLDTLQVFLPGTTHPIEVQVGRHFSRFQLSPDAAWAVGQQRTAAQSPGAQDDRLEIWDLHRYRRVPNHPQLEGGTFFGFSSPHGRWFLLHQAGNLEVCSTQTWAVARTYPLTRLVPGLASGPFAFSPQGSLLAVAFGPGMVRLVAWDEEGPPHLGLGVTLQSPDPMTLTALVFSPDGNYLAGLSGGRTIQLWDLQAVSERLKEVQLNGQFPREQQPLEGH